MMSKHLFSTGDSCNTIGAFCERSHITPGFVATFGICLAVPNVFDRLETQMENSRHNSSRRRREKATQPPSESSSARPVSRRVKILGAGPKTVYFVANLSIPATPASAPQKRAAQKEYERKNLAR